MTDLKSINRVELEQFFKELGEPKFRAKQVFQWLWRGVESFDEMTNLSKALREKLRQSCILTVPQVERKQVSKLDGTIKYLWRLADGNCVESVVMRYKHGNTICVSSEVGCRMGCAFCASTLGGLVRRLEPSEILDQVMFAQKDSGLTISNIVLMGIGEPLDNYDNVMRFLELVNDPEGLNIGMRHISLSTCGLVDGIDKLADLQLQLTLSVSLHAPDDETRSRLMPVNRSVGVERLLKSCRRYFDVTGRRISYEYAMVDGVNDQDWQADLLAKRLKGKRPGKEEKRMSISINKNGRMFIVECIIFQDLSFEISINDVTQEEEQIRLKRQLTQNIAHELKTPVSSIQGYLETIVNNENISREKMQTFLERCYAQSNRLSRLLRDISVLTRMDEAANMIDMEKVDISLLVGNIVNEVSLELEEKHITVVNSLKPKIQLRGNYSLLYSIFRNLMDNAIAYAGTDIRINISCFREDENFYYFSFADTGVGVSPEHLNRLFERFYRVDKGRSRKLGGTGLGLAIVKNSVIIHGGTISAKNNQGGGLEFVFTLAKEK